MSGVAYRPAASVAYVEHRVVTWDDQEHEYVYVAVLPNGPVSILEGPTAHTWSAAISVPEGEIVERIAFQNGVAPDQIREEVRRMLNDLLDRRLLAQASQ